MFNNQRQHARMRLPRGKLFFEHDDYADMCLDSDSVHHGVADILPKVSKCSSWEFLGFNRSDQPRARAPTIRAFGLRTLAAISSLLPDVCWFLPGTASAELGYMNA